MGRVRKFGSSSSSAKGDKHDDDDLPSGIAKAFVQSKLHEQKLRQAGLTPPEDFEGDMPELPDDVDAVDHSKLSNRMVAFQNALATATWQATMAYIEHDIAEEIKDYLENRALLASQQSNDSKRRAESKTDSHVVKWSAINKEAYHNYVRFRDLAKTIEGKIKVLSRVGGFKDDEQEASDRNAKSKPSIRSRRKSS